MLHDTFLYFNILFSSFYEYMIVIAVKTTKQQLI